MKKQLQSWLYVTIQAILLVLLVYFTDNQTKPPTLVLVVGKVIFAMGVLVLLKTFYDLRKSLTAMPLPKKNGQLQVRGLYKYVRHPMYIGVLSVCFGIAVSSGAIIKYVLVALLFILFWRKARFEEKYLAKKYSGYTEYVKKTPRFIPKIF